MNNPFRNAALAFAYILGVATLLFSIGEGMEASMPPIIGIASFLSLFVFSVALMAYVFIGLPLCLYLDGAKKEAVSLFWKTLLSFGCLAVLLFVLGISFF